MVTPRRSRVVSSLRRERDIERKEHTRQELLEAAIEVFSAKGYHRSLVSDIVAHAGLGQGTFYRHFTSKRELIDAIMDHFGQKLLSQFETMTVNLPSTIDEYREASKEALLAMALMMEENRKLVLLLLREAPAVDREFEQRVNGLLDAFASLASFYLDHAISQGFTRKCNTTFIGQAIVGIGFRHIILWLQDERDGIQIRELITELVDFAFLGLAPRTESLEQS